MNKILIADDTEANRYFLEKILRVAEYEVISVTNGVELTEQFRKATPDLVITDVKMPNLDGFEAVKEIRKIKAAQHIPIIFVSATYRDLASQIKGFELGANEYLNQPINEDELLAKVKAMLRTKNIYEQLLRSKEALSKSEKKYRVLFKNMLNGFAYHKMIFDEKGKPVDYIFLEINEAFKQLTGLSSDIIGKKVTSIFPGIEKNEPDLISIFGKVARTQEPATIEFYFKPLKRWHNIYAYSPKPNYFAYTFEDITKRKEAEKKLIQYKDHLEELVRERTAKLEEKNEELVDRNTELELYHDLFVNREFRIKELRDKVEVLQKNIQE